MKLNSHFFIYFFSFPVDPSKLQTPDKAKPTTSSQKPPSGSRPSSRQLHNADKSSRPGSKGKTKEIMNRAKNTAKNSSTCVVQ